MTTRLDYRRERLRHLELFVDTSKAIGLEIGASDFPVVLSGNGRCDYADFRTREEMIALWDLDPAAVVPVTYKLSRDEKVSGQISKTFEYVILCHVIEHVPNPLGYLQDLGRLLLPGGVLFVACPDKRRTLDVGRQSTSVAHLLDDFYHDSRYPALEHIIDHAKGWLPSQVNSSVAREAYEFACRNYESGQADPHCHVWTDSEFFDQMEYIVGGGLLVGLEVAYKAYNNPNFNEFYMLFRRQV